MHFRHLQTKNLSYVNHMFGAFRISFKLLSASIYVFIHAFYPDIFEYDGSSIIYSLHSEFENEKNNIIEKNNK